MPLAHIRNEGAKPVVYTGELGWHREGDLRVPDLLTKMDELIAVGCTVWVKFTCQHCQSRQASSEKNTFHVNGYTCEECGKVSIPKVYGMRCLFGAAP